MKINTFLAFLILISIFSGCRSIVTRSDTEERAPYPPPGPTLSVGSIEARQAYLKQLLREQYFDASDRKAVMILLNTYGFLKNALLRDFQEPKRMETIRILFKSIADLDEHFFSDYKEKRRVREDSVGTAVEKRKEILRSFLAHDHSGVIRQCDELEKSFGKDGFTSDVNIVFALSLAEEGRLEEAIFLGQQTLNQLETIPHTMYLRSRIAAWQLVLGNGEEALDLYEKLTDDLDERTALVKSLREKLTVSDRPLTVTPERKHEEKDSMSLQDVLRQANNLAQAHEFRKAEILLLNYKNRASAEEIDMIEKALELIRMAEDEEGKERIPEGILKKEALNTARQHLEKEEFETAIAKIDELSEYGSLEPEAIRIKEEAIEKLINRERNRAASLFLAARNADDPKEKKRYLIESREILQAVIEKYPSSPLNKRLRSHLKSVESELKKL